ncbi:hypothetical protein MASR2M79_21980 [Aminivibrio sp.]
MDGKLCLLVIIGTTDKGVKELVAVEDGYRESEASWHEVLAGLRARGLEKGRSLPWVTGAWFLECPERIPWCVHQRCRVHKTANVLNKVPKSLQGKVKADLHEIWMAEKQEDAEKALDSMTAKGWGQIPEGH